MLSVIIIAPRVHLSTAREELKNNSQVLFLFLLTTFFKYMIIKLLDCWKKKDETKSEEEEVKKGNR